MNAPQRPAATPNFHNLDVPLGMANAQDGLDQWQLNDESPQAGTGEDFNFNGAMPIDVPNVEGNFTWEMIGLGLEEPLPPQATIDELYVQSLWRYLEFSGSEEADMLADIKSTLTRSTLPPP